MDAIPLFRILNDEQDVEAVSSVIRRGHSWSSGPEIASMEKALAERVGVKHALLFNSGTSAQYADLLAYDIMGGEIIVPSFTFISTVNCVVLSGSRPVFAEIEQRTFGLDPDDVNEKVGNYTKAIMPVHFAGAPCAGIKALREIADDNGLILIEDAAESLGARLKGENVGTFGDSSMVSFCQNKIVTTGEGGAILTDDDAHARKLRLIRSHGRDDPPGSDYFVSIEKSNYVDAGHNFRISTLQAALGLAQLGKMDRIVSMRRERAARYDKGLSDLVGVPPSGDGIENVYQLYPILLRSKEARDGLMAHLKGEGIASKVYFHPVHLEEYYVLNYEGCRGMLPRTEEISGRILTLPLFPMLTDVEIDRIVCSVRGYLDSGGLP